MIRISLKKHRLTKKQIAEIDCESLYYRDRRNTPDFKPIPHIRWVEAFEAAAKARDIELWGLQALTKRYRVPNSDFHMSWLYRLPTDEGELPGKVAARSVGLAVSNGGQHRPYFYFGGLFGIEKEGGFCNFRSCLPRHSTADVEVDVGAVFDELPFHSRNTDQWTRELLETEMTPDEASGMILEAARQRLVPWSRLQIVDSYVRKMFAKRSYWHMIRGFARGVVRSTPKRQLEDLLKVFELVWNTSCTAASLEEE